MTKTLKAIGNSTGALGERLAAIFLQSKGHTILGKNYRKPSGELDIISVKAGIVHIIEVKTKEVEDFSRERDYEPEELVSKAKLRRVIMTAATYMAHQKDSRDYQIDVVSVLLNKKTQIARCKYIEQVIEEP